MCSRAATGISRATNTKCWAWPATARPKEEMVVYRALYGERGLWVRPAAMWCETVERDGKVQPRFVRIEE